MALLVGGLPNVARSASASASVGTEALLEAMGNHRIVLLGEVHDNAAQHALRADALRRRIEAGARPAILMEQFDRERQPEIDAARALPGATADSVVAAGAPAGAGVGGGWNWAFYRPFVALALAYRLPLVAVNVSRADLRGIVAAGLDVDGFDPEIPADIRVGQGRAIVAGHCGRLDPADAGPWVAAQVARDQFMAHAIELHADEGAVLLAGNGHVRADIGVPRWLTPESRRSAVSIGLREPDDGLLTTAFDAALTTAAAPRADPCEGMR